MKSYDPSAIGSDIARSKAQYVARRFGSCLVSMLGLNGAGFLSTEIVQQIHPVFTIPTRFGGMRCKCGHGRLRWRAATFYTEEPETIRWLERLTVEDLLWDVGANVGLYSIYAAKHAGCKVVAFEPEAQNFAALLENVFLNEAQELVDAANVAVAGRSGLGRLEVHAMTKGGAYNQFKFGGNGARGAAASVPLVQLQMGVSLDDLVGTFGFGAPTHIKIDVDGNEPEIVAGGLKVLAHPRCKSVLVEVQLGDPNHREIPRQLEALGYRCVSERSNWESRENREREHEYPATNMIFNKL